MSDPAAIHQSLSIAPTSRELPMDGATVSDAAIPFDQAAPARVSATAPRQPALTGLFVLALLCVSYFASAFLIPIAFAVLLWFLLSPAIRAMRKLHFPAPLAAACVVLGFAGVAGTGVYELAGPVRGWVTHAPETLRKAGARLRLISAPVDQVAKAADQVDRATATTSAAGTQEVVVKGPTLASRLFGTTQTLVEAGIEIVVLLYFLLAAGDLFLEKLVKVLPQIEDKRAAVVIARTIESSISSYLLTAATMNLAEGSALTLALWALGAPTPWLWGALLVFLEFIPYIGMAIMVVLLTVVGLTTFAAVPHALALPGAFMAINFVQGNIVSPLVMSKRLTLNPVALFLGLAFWWWMWGIAGALLAVPFMAVFKICCDHLDRLSTFGEFLGGRDSDERRNAVRLPDDEVTPTAAVP